MQCHARKNGAFQPKGYGSRADLQAEGLRDTLQTSDRAASEGGNLLWNVAAPDRADLGLRCLVLP